MRDCGDLQDCPVRDVLAHVGAKWSTLVVATLGEQPPASARSRPAMPDISQRMLTKTLRDLQRDGLVHREVFPTVPPSVEYSLTDLGASLLTPLEPLIQWAAANHTEIREARETFEAG